MHYLDVLKAHTRPTIVVMGPRMRSSLRDQDFLEYTLAGLKEVGRPITIRVSGMIAGPEDMVERLAPPLGFDVEVFGTPPEHRARRMCKNDDLERDATCLVDAHALWVFPTAYQLRSSDIIEDIEFVEVAQGLGVPVFLFLPEEMDFEVVEYV
jgi:hypothetical protein